jgi:hypothetical protein
MIRIDPPSPIDVSLLPPFLLRELRATSLHDRRA